MCGCFDEGGSEDTGEVVVWGGWGGDVGGGGDDTGGGDNIGGGIDDA